METDVELKSKFSNIFIMLLFGVMSNDLDNVRHFLGKDIYQKYQGIINQNIKNNETQMFDEFNVKSIEIVSKKEFNDYYLVEVNIFSRYMDYVIDSDTKEYKRGINDRRVEKKNVLKFKKLKNDVQRSSVIKCEYCGANMDINFNGKCEYCGQFVDVTSYDYLLVDISTV